MRDVKAPTKRAQRARETRQRIVAAARELFVDQGYGATTLQDVAAAAGVAVQTIYFIFGNKRMLLKELVDVTIAGDDEPVATMDRPWFRDAMATGTADQHLRAHVAGTLRILQRVAAISRMVEAAAAMDAEVAALWPEDDLRFAVHSTAATALMAKPGARPDVPAEQAADLLYGLLSPELYLVFVGERGWPPGRWEQWVHQTLHTELCS
jgi:AcrR family transcriptional regulator